MDMRLLMIMIIFNLNYLLIFIIVGFFFFFFFCFVRGSKLVSLLFTFNSSSFSVIHVNEDIKIESK